MTHVEQLTAVAPGGLTNRPDVDEPRVHPTGHIEAGGKRVDDGLDPSLGYEAAGISDADDHRPRARCSRLLDRHVAKPERRAAAVEPELADASLGSPVDDAARRLRREVVVRVAEKQEIGLVHGPSPPVMLSGRW